MISRKKKGQSTLEYVLLVTAVIVVIIALVLNPNSPFKQSLNSTLNAGISDMENFATQHISH
jgi:uncharacterized protein (UPF0333 family)